MSNADEVDYYDTDVRSGAVGLDVGAVLTKVFRRGAAPVVRPTPNGPGRGRLLADLMGSRHAQPRVGVARPEAGAASLSAALTESGVREPIYVRSLLCLAAAHQVRRGLPAGAQVHIVCDTGASCTAAAACVVDGSQVRLIAVEHAESPEIAGILGAPADWVAGQAVSRARRANLVLGRAMSDPRYRSTPVYFGPDRQIAADVVLKALAPIAATTRAVVSRLAERVAEHLDVRTEVVLTGVLGTTPPVHRAVADTLGQGRPTRLLEPSAVAEGALLVAEGRVQAAEDYPHTVGLVVRRVHKGRLESTVLTIAERGRPLGSQASTHVHIAEGFAGPLPVRLRIGGEWQPWTVENGRIPAPGHYTAEVSSGRSSTGVVVLRPAGGAQAIHYPLAEQERGW